ncbi:MAG: S9 family peptidase [Candidatus Dormibacteraceae bacterium]
MAAPDGGLIFAASHGGHAQPYYSNRPGGEMHRLAESADRMVPHLVTDHGLVVRHDSGGNEIWQLSLLKDFRVSPLSVDSKAIHGDAVLRPDGQALGLTWNPAGGRDMVIGEMDLPSGELRTWAAPGGFWIFQGYSPDGSRAIVAQSFGGSHVESQILLRSGAMTRLLPSSRTVGQAHWLARGLFVIADDGGDFQGLAEVDPDRPGAVGRWLLKPEHDVTAFVPAPAGDRALVIVNAGIHDRLSIIELPGGDELEHVDLGPGVVVGDHTGEGGYHVAWSTDGSRVHVAWDRPDQPADILTWPGDKRWTGVNPEPIAVLRLPVEVSYPSFDGLTIGALLYRVDEAPRPTVCLFHGGPEGQSRSEYRAIYHLLNGIGVNVLAPNVRGSTGYGYRFQALDDKTLRWDSVKDGCEAARWLRREGMATKVAAMGGSYGGFMTLAVIVEDPELWDAAVDTVGVARWKTFFEHMPPWRGVLRMEEYGDPFGAEEEYLESISPLHRAGAIRAPLLVVHGRNDPRVPCEESEQIAAAAPDAEILIFENEGHGIARHENQVTYNRRVLEFLGRRLA